MEKKKVGKRTKEGELRDHFLNKEHMITYPSTQYTSRIEGNRTYRDRHRLTIMRMAIVGLPGYERRCDGIGTRYGKKQ